jgi:transcriptional regulator with XRE-family HTH domain
MEVTMRYAGEDPGAEIYRDIGERILLARRRAKMSQRELAERLGISHVAVGDIERGKTRPDLGNLTVIADKLSVPLTQIVVLRWPAQRSGGEPGAGTGE